MRERVLRSAFTEERVQKCEVEKGDELNLK